MLKPTSFLCYLEEDLPGDERKVLARFALHLLYDAEAYPFDISEMLSLSEDSHLYARGMLNYCLIDPACFVSVNEFSLRKAIEYASVTSDSRVA
nr:hypothetical protein [Stenotrophomonas geniculata]